MNAHLITAKKIVARKFCTSRTYAPAKYTPRIDPCGIDGIARLWCAHIGDFHC